MPCRERTLIVLGLRTGLRLTSMLSLRIGDVAIAGIIQTRIRVRRRTTKGKRFGFDMPLHPQAVSTLQDYVATLSDRRPGAFLPAASPAPAFPAPPDGERSRRRFEAPE